MTARNTGLYLGPLNHAYTIMSVILLKRLVAECCNFFSDWQTGFWSKRGCRDNVLLLRVLYDKMINANSKYWVTYIDFSATFDTVRRTQIHGQHFSQSQCAQKESRNLWSYICSDCCNRESKWNRRKFCLLRRIQRWQRHHLRRYYLPCVVHTCPWRFSATVRFGVRQRIQMRTHPASRHPRLRRRHRTDFGHGRWRTWQED